MGTDPSFFSTPKVDAREADYEQVDAEMKKLQKFIREATRTQGRRLLIDDLSHQIRQLSSDRFMFFFLDILPKTDTEEELIITTAVSSSMDGQSVNR